MQRSEPARQLDRYSRADAGRSTKVLLLTDEPRCVSGVRSAIQGTAAKLTRISTVEEALPLLSDESFDFVIVDRHLGGWLSPQACKALVTTAGPIPVVGLINEDCVLDLRDGVEAGLTGVYYKDQIDAHLMRRLSQLAHLPSLAPLRAEPAALPQLRRQPTAARLTAK